MAEDMAARYGGGVTVRYVDVFSPEMFEQHGEVLQLIATRGLPLPLVSIAGKPRFAGGISTPRIEEALALLGLEPVARI